MLIRFTSIDFPEDPDMLEDIFISPAEPSIKKPKTLSANFIEEMSPSIFNPEWTDIMKTDGDIIVAEESYHEMDLKWQIALGFKPEKLWESKKALDGKIEIRCFTN